MNVELPAALVAAGFVSTDWTAALPAVLAELAKRWDLEIGDPFQPGGATSWVAPVGRCSPSAAVSAGSAVLKVAPADYESRDEAAGLRAWGGDGVVEVLADAVLGDSVALLLEACEPGTPLRASSDEESQDRVVAGLLRRLWDRPGPAGDPFRPLVEMCDRWADNFAAAGTSLVREGVELFRALPRSAAETRLLATDLHPGNVLAARREPWLVIDPKPFLGDPAYDVLQHMLNFPRRLAADPEGFADRMAALVDLDAARVRAWLFARLAVESDDCDFGLGDDLDGVLRRLAPG